MKNLLFIGVDQLRWDAVGPQKTLPTITPHIDRLIADGVSFQRSYATCPLCTPSRASMFTGDYAFRHGMGTNCDMYHALGKELAEPERLLHLDLAKAGFRCGFVGKWHVGVEKGPSDYGFEGNVPAGYGNLTKTTGFLDYLAEQNLEYTVEPTLFWNPNRQTMAGGLWHGSVESTPCFYQTNQAIDMVSDMAETDAPFFISMQYWDPHGPHLIPDEFAGITDRAEINPWINFRDDLSDKATRVRRERDDFYRLHPREDSELIEYIGMFCDHVALLDSQVGRLLEHLENIGLRDETLIVFTSDHGDMTGSHGGLIDKGLPYEEAMRVPLVFANPTLPKGERNGLALNMDILPTAIGLLGIPFDQRHARDLSDEVLDSSKIGRDALLAEFHGLRFLFSQRILVSDDNWKYVFSPGDDDELYDLNSDPHEMTNLAASATEKLSQMRKSLMRETARYDDPLRDCVSKFNGVWRTGSGQFDATSAYLTGSDKSGQ
ncbi:MAG: sulfatase-like hydrolase/transferase [Paracoccaceae bacterium]|nr:sulfatase-like hydrolase/transferase [Paracoccaceae bacterium]MDG2258499.1 sulfatase-like hydrolase/transferase [Paracoccaceae bacterium]